MFALESNNAVRGILLGRLCIDDGFWGEHSMRTASHGSFDNSIGGARFGFQIIPANSNDE